MSSKTTNYTLLSTASTNANSVTQEATTLYSVSLYNYSVDALAIVKLYDKAGVPDENDTPVLVYPAGFAPAEGDMAGNVPDLPSGGIRFNAGIGVRVTAVDADDDTTDVAAGAVRLNLGYALL